MAIAIVRPLLATDRDALKALVAREGLFTTEEVSVANELVDAALDEPEEGYRVLVAEQRGCIVGYVCYGPTPMTETTFDLYWIVTDPDARGRGRPSTRPGRCAA